MSTNPGTVRVEFVAGDKREEVACSANPAAVAFAMTSFARRNDVPVESVKFTMKEPA